MSNINMLETPPTELELAELLNDENFTDAGKLILRKLIFQKEKAMDAIKEMQKQNDKMRDAIKKIENVNFGYGGDCGVTSIIDDLDL